MRTRMGGASVVGKYGWTVAGYVRDLTTVGGARLRANTVCTRGSEAGKPPCFGGCVVKNCG